MTSSDYEKRDGVLLLKQQNSDRKDRRNFAKVFVARQACIVSAIEYGEIAPNETLAHAAANASDIGGKTNPRPYAVNLPDADSSCPKEIASNSNRVGVRR